MAVFSVLSYILYYWIVFIDALMCKQHVSAVAGRGGARLKPFYILLGDLIYNNASYLSSTFPYSKYWVNAGR